MANSSHDIVTLQKSGGLATEVYLSVLIAAEEVC